MPLPVMPIFPAHAFDAYARTVLPHNATPAQVEDCRRAFYAGVSFTLRQFHDFVGSPEVSEEEGVHYLNAIGEECDQFFAALRAGQTPPDPRAALGQMNYTTRDPDQIANKMREIGGGIGAALPPGYGFMLMIFNYGEGGAMFYISSGEREDMIKAMREFIQKNTQ